MNKIKPRYVDFNIAKWLKEKGFDENTTYWYSYSGEIHCDDEFKNQCGWISNRNMFSPRAMDGS